MSKSMSGWNQLHPNCVRKEEHERIINEIIKDAVALAWSDSERMVLRRVKEAIDKVYAYKSEIDVLVNVGRQNALNDLIEELGLDKEEK